MRSSGVSSRALRAGTASARRSLPPPLRCARMPRRAPLVACRLVEEVLRRVLLFLLRLLLLRNRGGRSWRRARRRRRRPALVAERGLGRALVQARGELGSTVASAPKPTLSSRFRLDAACRRPARFCRDPCPRSSPCAMELARHGAVGRRRPGRRAGSSFWVGRCWESSLGAAERRFAGLGCSPASGVGCTDLLLTASRYFTCSSGPAAAVAGNYARGFRPPYNPAPSKGAR